MGMIFMCLDIEDATVESMSDAALDPEGFTQDAEQVIREALNVPPELTVTLAPFRNGIVLSPDAAQRVIGVFEGFDEAMRTAVSIESYMPALSPEDEEVLETLKTGLEVIGHGGSEPA